MNNRQILLASRPQGEPTPENFRLVETPVPALQDGQVLVRHRFLSLDPYMRGRMSDAKSYAEPQPLDAVMIGGTVGEVVDSRSPRFSPGDAVVGMMSQPFTGELFYANALGAHYEGPGGPRRLATRKTTSLSDATLFTTTPALFAGEARDRYDRLEALVRLARYGVDCYAFAMLAAGSIDVVVEAGLKPYDIVALIPIIERAGGLITTVEGGPAEKGGDIVAAATPELHAAAMATLRG